MYRHFVIWMSKHDKLWFYHTISNWIMKLTHNVKMFLLAEYVEELSNFAKKLHWVVTKFLSVCYELLYIDQYLPFKNILNVSGGLFILKRLGQGSP